MTSHTRAWFRRGIFCALIGGAAALGGCATITRGTNESWTVASDPPGATAIMSNGFRCDITPCTITMPRKTGFTVTVSKPGYKTATAEVTAENKGGAALAGNILVGGIVGAVVDSNNGSLNDLLPNPLNVKLEKDDGSAPVAAAPAPAATPAPAASTSASSASN